MSNPMPIATNLMSLVDSGHQIKRGEYTFARASNENYLVIGRDNTRRYLFVNDAVDHFINVSKGGDGFFVSRPEKER